MIDKTYDECIPMFAERTRERMKWVWEEDLDASYERRRDASTDVNGMNEKESPTSVASLPAP